LAIILKSVVGLDLGSHSIKAVHLRQTLRGLQAVQFRELPREDEAPLTDLLAQLFRMHQLPTEHVVAALPGDRVSSRRLTFPFRDRRRLSQAVPFEVEDDLPFPLDEVVVDWDLVGVEDGQARVVAHVAPKSEVAALLETLADAGCEPRTLEAEGLVLANLGAVFDLPETCLLADVGHRKTTFCLLRGGRAVAARSVPLAGRALTLALARDRGLPPEEAERAKCEEGGLDARGAAGETRAVLERLAREFARTLASFEAALAGAPPAELTLCGGTARLAGLDGFLAERLGLPAARLGLPREGGDPGLAAAGDPGLFAPALALALRGTGQARTAASFRREEFAWRPQLVDLRRDLRWPGILAVAVTALAVVAFGTQAWVDSRRAATLEAQIAEVYGDVFPDRPVPERPVPALREAVDEAHDRADFLGVYRGNLSALDLLARISDLVPEDLEIVFEELSIDGQTVRMRVFSKSFEAADRLQARLAEFEPFGRPRIGAIETDRQRGGKRFTLTINMAEAEERA